MNVEAINQVIQIKVEKDSFGTSMVRGRLIVERDRKINFGVYLDPAYLEEVEDQVRREIIHALFQDQRDELLSAVREIFFAQPFDYLAVQKANEKLAKAARYQGEGYSELTTGKRTSD